MPSDTNAPYGYREDGTPKVGSGWLGQLPRPGGGFSSELSIGVDIGDGKETLIPTLVPTLSPQEVQWLLNNPPDPKKIPKSIVNKAVAHARNRIGQGQSPFAGNQAEYVDFGGGPPHRPGAPEKKYPIPKEPPKKLDQDKPTKYTLDELYGALLTFDAEGKPERVKQVQELISREQARLMSEDPGAERVFEETGMNPLGYTGRTGQIVTQGVEALAGMPVDTLENIANLGLAARGVYNKEILGQSSEEAFPELLGGTPGGSEWMRTSTPGVSGASPQNLGEKIGVTLPSALIGPKRGLFDIGKDLAGTVLPTTVAHEVQQRGGGAAGQTGGALATVAAQAAAGRYGKPAFRRVMGGGEGAAAELARQRAAGITEPSPSTLTGGTGMLGTEQALSAMPGADLMAHQRAQRRTAGVERKVGELAESFLPPQSPEDLVARLKGETVPGSQVPDAEKVGEGAKEGAEAYKRHVKEVSEKLYGSMEDAKSPNYIPPLTPVPTTKTLQTIREFKRDYQNDPAVMKYLNGLEQEITRAKSPRTPMPREGPWWTPKPKGAKEVPFSLMNRRRQEAGRKLGENTALIRTVPDRIYAGISESLMTDIEGALPKGTRQRTVWDRARKYTSLVHSERIRPMTRYYKQKDVEMVLKTALGKSKLGASQFRRVMKGLDQMGTKGDEIRAHIIDSLGRAKPSGAGMLERGEFSMDTFIANWKNLSRGVRKVMFKDPKTADAMDNIARTMDKYRKSGSFLYNPPESGKKTLWGHSALIFLGGLSTAATGAVTGHPTVAASGLVTAGGIAGSIGTGVSLSAAMHSERFIQWLAGTTNVSREKRPQYLAQLQSIAQQEQNRDTQKSLQAVHDFLARQEGIKLHQQSLGPPGGPPPSPVIRNPPPAAPMFPDAPVSPHVRQP